jgi:hypothetical protein
MEYVPNGLRLASTYRYIGDTIAELIDQVARESAGDDVETAVTTLTAHLIDLGAARCTEDPAWCRYALEASRRGEPIIVVV